MALVDSTNSPQVGDTVNIQISTTDFDGLPLTPYKVSTVTIYYLQRDPIAEATGSQSFQDGDNTVYYANAVPVKVYGNEGNPAWLSSDLPDAWISQVTEDANGNPLAGVFAVQWDSSLSQEGDYYVCWTWEPIIASSTLSAYTSFRLSPNIAATTATPAHQTAPGKYQILMQRYLPEMYTNVLSTDDVTPDVLTRFQNAVGQAFTFMEDQANAMLDLSDANALQPVKLPYLANLFKWRLKSNDPTLWRRQIKEAMSQYKKKGTLAALQEALNQADMTLENITKYWQVVSKSTWQDGFRVQNNGDTAFTLTKIPILPIDPLNYSLQIMPAGSYAYANLDISNVSFTVLDGVGYMDWIGTFDLNQDDILKVVYKVASVPDQTIEDYIRSLPLMDNRSEAVMRDLNICYPLKNWNVRLIADDDSMLPVVCPTRNPWHTAVVFGKVRTEFAYSENIYNMEEYNGSLRDSTNPCDIDRSFVDSCPCCLSSSISVDVELQQLSNDRMTECMDILREFLPFHVQLYSVNFNGAVDEYILPPVEEISTYIVNNYTDNILNGQLLLNRTIQPWTDNFKRDMLASMNNLVTDTTGLGSNLAVTLYYPAANFDPYTMGLDVDNNYLEILSGLNTGTYSVTNPQDHLVDFAVPTEVSSPFDQTRFPFRLSNIRFTGSGDIYQDNVFHFSDANVNFSQYNMTFANVDPSNWRIVVTAGPNAGTYPIAGISPDGSLTILNWPTNTNATNLQYDLFTDGGMQILASNTGSVTVQWRGRFETSDDLLDQYLIEPGYYLLVNGSQYVITGFRDQSTAYLDAYQAGTQVGIPSVQILKRLIDNGTGYVGVRGVRISTTTDYYDALQVSDQMEDDQHMQNFMVLIGTDYYQIASWSNTPDGSGRYEIVLNGTPVPEWGTTGVSNITFSIIQFLKTRPVVVTTGNYPVITQESLPFMDRRGDIEIIDNTVTTPAAGLTAAMAAALLNAANNGQPVDMVQQGEKISFTIEYKK